jgi:ANTAR domain
MVMLTYTIDADAAFEMLRWWSQQYNIKVATLAEQLVVAAAREQITHRRETQARPSPAGHHRPDRASKGAMSSRVCSGTGANFH